MNDDREQPRQLRSDLKLIGGEGMLPAFRPQPWAATLIAGDSRSVFISADMQKSKKKPDREEWF